MSQLTLNDLLEKHTIDPCRVLVFRHRPIEPQLRKVLPWLAAEKPDIFNAYQQTQGEKVERALSRALHVASFIGHQPGKALFVALYEVGKSKPMTYDEYWQVPAYKNMQQWGMLGFQQNEGRSQVL